MGRHERREAVLVAPPEKRPAPLPMGSHTTCRTPHAARCTSRLHAADGAFRPLSLRAYTYYAMRARTEKEGGPRLRFAMLRWKAGKCARKPRKEQMEQMERGEGEGGRGGPCAIRIRV